MHYDLGKHGYTGHIGFYGVYLITGVNMGTQDIIVVYRVYSIARVNTSIGYTRVYKVYSITRVKLGKRKHG